MRYSTHALSTLFKHGHCRTEEGIEQVGAVEIEAVSFCRQELTEIPYRLCLLANCDLASFFLRFGVRALPKQQMVLKLKEIFQFTHQQAGTDSKKKSMPASSSSFQKLQQKCLSPYRLLQGSPNTTNRTDLSEGGTQRPEAGLGWPKGAALPANRAIDGESNGDLILTTSEVQVGTRAGSETYAASQRYRGRLEGVCSFFHSDFLGCWHALSDAEE